MPTLNIQTNLYMLKRTLCTTIHLSVDAECVYLLFNQLSSHSYRLERDLGDLKTPSSPNPPSRDGVGYEYIASRYGDNFSGCRLNFRLLCKKELNAVVVAVDPALIIISSSFNWTPIRNKGVELEHWPGYYTRSVWSLFAKIDQNSLTRGFLGGASK